MKWPNKFLRIKWFLKRKIVENVSFFSSLHKNNEIIVNMQYVCQHQKWNILHSFVRPFLLSLYKYIFTFSQVLVDQRHSRFVRNVRVGRTHSEERRNFVRNLQRRNRKVRSVVRAAIHRWLGRGSDAVGDGDSFWLAAERKMFRLSLRVFRSRRTCWRR